MRITLLTFFISFSAQANSLDFKQVIQRIKENDTALYAKRFDLKAAKSERTAGRYAFLPSLNLGHEINRAYKTDQAGNRSYLKADLNLFKGGSDFYANKESSLNFQKAQQELLDTEIETEKKAIEALIEFIKQRRAQQITKRQEKQAQDIFAAVNKRFKQGLGPKQERDKAQVDALNASAQVSQAKIEETQARWNILQLLNEFDQRHDSETSVSIDDKWPWEDKIKALQASQIQNTQYNPMLRPRTKALKFDYEREMAKVKNKKSPFMPQVDLSYTWSRQEITKNINPFLVGFNRNDQTALLKFTLPLFNQYKDVSDYKRQKVGLANANALYRDAIREDYSQWLSIKDRLINALSTIKSRLMTQKLGESIYQTSYKRFRAARATVNDLAIDQNRLFQSQNLANEGMAQFHLLLRDFCHLQGKLIKDCFSKK